MTDEAGFPVEPGDTVRWWTKEGFSTGRFVRFARDGRAVVVPVGKRSEKYVDRLYPVNDLKSVARRGRVTLSGYNDDAPNAVKKVRRR